MSGGGAAKTLKVSALDDGAEKTATALATQPKPICGTLALLVLPGFPRGALLMSLALPIRCLQVRTVAGALFLMYRDQCAQEELSMTRQKLVGWKLMFLKASTSRLTVPNVLFGRCFIPS